MRLLKTGTEVELSVYIKQAESILKKENIYILESTDHAVHAAAYIAWRNVGGNILVLPPLVESIKIQVKTELAKILPTLFNSVVFLTSGTTGSPKLVIHTYKQFDQALKMSSAVFNWGTSERILILVPAFVVGYWLMALPCATYTNSTLVITGVDTICDDIVQPGDQLLGASGHYELLRYRKTLSDYSLFSKILLGGSHPTINLYNYIFSHGGRSVTNAYGSTEIGVPILSREVTSSDSNYNHLGMLSNLGAEFKLMNGELYVKSESVCSNYRDYPHDDEWFGTQDIWELSPDSGLIRFTGRSNDIVKVNGYRCNLLQLEVFMEENTNLGECLAVVRKSMGVEWIEILYTNSSTQIDRQALIKLCTLNLDKNCIPKKYTFTEHILKTAMKKKIRTLQ
jgi:acyl-coenzyme A synthetase/AMP-(fatty) acid ligase